MCNDYTLPLGWQLGTTALWRSRGVWKTLPSSSVRRLAVASDASACRLTVQQDPSDRRPDRETRSPIILTPGTPRASLYFGGSVHADDRSESCHRSPTPGPRVRGLLELRRVDSRFGAGDRLQSFLGPHRHGRRVGESGRRCHWGRRPGSWGWRRRPARRPATPWPFSK